MRLHNPSQKVLDYTHESELALKARNVHERFKSDTDVRQVTERG